jgi:thiamine biosynthesis lipoprotein
MGTFVTVCADGDVSHAEDSVRQAFDAMRNAAARMNHPDEDSEIGRLNATGFLQRAAPDTLAVIAKALRLSELCGGVFDISALPAVKLWGAYSGVEKTPSAREIADAASLTDYAGVIIEGSSVRLAREGMQITLAGVAKGYIVDKAISVLENCGVTRALVDGGGDVRVICGPNDPPWRVGVRDPQSPERLLCAIKARDIAVASSGPYAHAYNDIIDPRTGMPARGVIGASVVCGETATADALATCLSVFEPEKGVAFIEKHRELGAAALIVSADGARHATSNWQRHRSFSSVVPRTSRSAAL